METPQDLDAALQALSLMCNVANGQISLMLKMRIPESSAKRDQVTEVVKDLSHGLKKVIGDFKLPIPQQPEFNFGGTLGEGRDTELIKRLE
jgi:hypothetical protein